VQSPQGIITPHPLSISPHVAPTSPQETGSQHPSVHCNGSPPQPSAISPHSLGRQLVRQQAQLAGSNALPGSQLATSGQEHEQSSVMTCGVGQAGRQSPSQQTPFSRQATPSSPSTHPVSAQTWHGPQSSGPGSQLPARHCPGPVQELPSSHSTSSSACTSQRLIDLSQLIRVHGLPSPGQSSSVTQQFSIGTATHPPSVGLQTFSVQISPSSAQRTGRQSPSSQVLHGPVQSVSQPPGPHASHAAGSQHSPEHAAEPSAQTQTSSRQLWLSAQQVTPHNGGRTPVRDSGHWQTPWTHSAGGWHAAHAPSTQTWQGPQHTLPQPVRPSGQIH
jgi:hypothetical protein